MNKKTNKAKAGLLTEQMDVKSIDFNKFQAKLLNKSRERTEEQKLNIELLALKYKIEDYLQDENKVTQKAGDFIKQYLKVLKIKQNKFAEYIGMKPSNFTKLLKGERPINYELALIFGKLFNINPLVWIEIQAKNEILHLKKIKEKELYNISLKNLLHFNKKNIQQKV